MQTNSLANNCCHIHPPCYNRIAKSSLLLLFHLLRLPVVPNRPKHLHHHLTYSPIMMMTMMILMISLANQLLTHLTQHNLEIVMLVLLSLPQ